jgi:hypothetical protein
MKTKALYPRALPDACPRCGRIVHQLGADLVRCSGAAPFPQTCTGRWSSVAGLKAERLTAEAIDLIDALYDARAWLTPQRHIPARRHELRRLNAVWRRAQHRFHRRVMALQALEVRP